MQDIKDRFMSTGKEYQLHLVQKPTNDDRMVLGTWTEPLFIEGLTEAYYKGIHVLSASQAYFVHYLRKRCRWANLP
jgi:hypothetical protein